MLGGYSDGINLDQLEVPSHELEFKYPEVRGFYNRMFKYFDIGNFEMCIKECEKIIGSYKEDEDTYFFTKYNLKITYQTRALCYQNLGKYDKAIESYRNSQKIITRNTRNGYRVNTHLEIAKILCLYGKYVEALIELKKSRMVCKHNILYGFQMSKIIKALMDNKFNDRLYIELKRRGLDKLYIKFLVDGFKIFKDVRNKAYNVEWIESFFKDESQQDKIEILEKIRRISLKFVINYSDVKIVTIKKGGLY